MFAFGAGVKAPIGKGNKVVNPDFLLSNTIDLAPTFKSAATASINGFGLAVNKPAGTVQGNYIFAYWSSRGVLADADMPLPTGWTQLVYNQVSTGPSVKLAYKIAGSSEPSSYTFTPLITSAHSIMLLRYGGVNQETPLDAEIMVNEATTGTTMTALGLTTVTPGSVVLAFFSNHTVTSTDITPPPGTIERVEITSQCRSTAAELAVPSAGVVANLDAAQATSARWSAITVALRPISEGSAADVQITIGSQYAVAKPHNSLTIVDNNLHTGFTGATTQKNTGLNNLAGQFHHCNAFIESFGMGSTLGDWDGISDSVNNLPTPNLNAWISYFNILDARINPDSWGVFGHRVPWQFTGNTTDSGVTTRSTSADYNQESRRLLTNKVPQYIEWVAQWSSTLMMHSPKIRIFYLGSESKGYQTVVKVEVNGVIIRADRSQSWDWDDYEGTPGRADMGNFAYFLAFQEGIIQGAQRAGLVNAGRTNLNTSNVHVVSPYPVISHQGAISDGGSADAVKTNTIAAAVGSAVDTSDINGNATYPGWPNIAAVTLTFEHFRLLQVHGITSPFWQEGADYGTFNEDGQILANDSDHDIAYYRVFGMETFIDKAMAKYGHSNVVKRQPEYYAKAQRPMDVVGVGFIDEALRDDYQASIRAAWLFGCYDKGVDFPDMWSPFGRGDQSYLGGTDPNQWYGGMIVRTVTDNNNHPGTAVVGGGAKQAAWDVMSGLKTHFSPGTPLHTVSRNNNLVRAIASNTKVALVNQTGNTVTVSINSSLPVSLDPYKFLIVDR